MKRNIVRLGVSGLLLITTICSSCNTTTIATTTKSTTTTMTSIARASTTTATTSKTTSTSPVSTTTQTSTTTTRKPQPLEFIGHGYTDYGSWTSDVIVSDNQWQSGQALNIQSSLTVLQSHIDGLTKGTAKVDGFCLLITAERTFDAGGVLRLPSDERMSSLLTPTGLAIEGGVQGAVTNRFGYDFRTPVDEFATIPLSSAQKNGNQVQVFFNVATTLPKDLPPGIYRLRFDYGVTYGKSNYSLNGETFASRPATVTTGFQQAESDFYSPPIRASGTYVTGQQIDATQIQPRIPWLILANYASNGYYGAVADEDKSTFALSGRNLIPDDVILPLYAGDNKTKLSYSLEPQFPEDTIDANSNIPWAFNSGEISIQVTGPDGKMTDLGTQHFVGNAGQWPTTKMSTITAWKPAAYGYYTVKETGWINDIWGNRYEGGGTYHFWIAKRMTLATATFQGQAYPVGTKYGKDIAFDPAVPATVKVTATLFPNSDATKAKSITYSGTASPGGIYGAAQGMQPFLLDSPGEYCAHILAQYTDQEGHLWVESMTHAGVVYPTDTTIAAHGKKLTDSKGKLVDEGDTNTEGYVDTQDVSHLQHNNYPYQVGDVLLIAADHQGTDKVEPVLTYSDINNPAPYDPRLQTIGQTNIKLQTSNGYSPHLFPEYITDWNYYYGAAPRPGFMGRFIVGENGTRAPYWPVSPNAFGGQVNASSNGDTAGTIYRLIGGVVLRKQNTTPVYAGYMANAFIMTAGTNDNRVITAGSQDLLGSDNTKSRLFLVSTRPGMIYETGTGFTPTAQIDPILPATVTYTLTYPDGRVVTTTGQGDSFGNFAGKDKWILDIPGIYHYNVSADWQGYKGYMPGLPKDGGNFYVIEKDKPAGAVNLKLNLPEQSSFAAAGTLTITGTSTASSVSYAALTPGAVLDGGTLTVTGGKFSYTFDPAALAAKIPIYNVINVATGKPEIQDVVQLTFFSTENVPGGGVYHSAVRVIIRGTAVLYVY